MDCILESGNHCYLVTESRVDAHLLHGHLHPLLRVYDVYM